MNSRRNSHPVLPLLADLISRGDGTFILRPRLPDSDLDTWITVKDAARILGDIDRRTIYLWLGRFLVYIRPLPRKPKVSLKSVRLLKRAMQDPDFWENAELQDRVQERVRVEMARLMGDSQP